MTNITKAAQQALDALFVAYDQTCSVGRPKDWKQIKDAIDALSKALQDKAGEVGERAAFEVYADDQGFPLKRLETGGGGDYLDLRTQGAWEAWQARASLPTQPAAQATPEPVQPFLVRDVAALLDVSVPDVCKALNHLGHGQRSTNMEIKPEEALSVAHHIRATTSTPTQQAAVEPATIEDNSQQWEGMDGATAWHLIDRHADGWGDIAKMMGEWLKANSHPAPGVPEGWEQVGFTVSGDVTNWARDFSMYRTQHYTRPVFAAAIDQLRTKP